MKHLIIGSDCKVIVEGWKEVLSGAFRTLPCNLEHLAGLARHLMARLDAANWVVSPIHFPRSHPIILECNARAKKVTYHMETAPVLPNALLVPYANGMQMYLDLLAADIRVPAIPTSMNNWGKGKLRRHSASGSGDLQGKGKN